MPVSRPDGRAAHELRPIRIQPGYLRTAPGSALIEAGSTRVLCTTFWEDRVPAFRSGSGGGWLTAEYGMLPGCSPQRVPRESATGRVNGRTREIQRLIGRSLRAALDLDALGERTLHVDCDVIEADGGTRTASVTGAYVALRQAIAAMMKQRLLDRDPVREAVAAVSVGIVAGDVLVDLCYAEDAAADTDMNVVVSRSGGIIELQGTAEGRPFSREQAGRLVDAACDGVHGLFRAQEKALQGVD